MTTPRKGAWTKGQRLQLSAILHPHVNDAPDFHLTASQAWTRLADSSDLPTTLDAEAEKHRAQQATRASASLHWAKVTVSESHWNALIALWSELEGFPFVFDLVLPAGGRLNEEFFPSHQMPGFFAACRRYLQPLDEQQYGAALARAQPIFSASCIESRSDDQLASIEARLLRDGLAFAFSRETDWASQVLRDFDDGGPLRLAALSVADDAALAKTSVERSMVDTSYLKNHVFDLVENYEADAVMILEAFENHDAFRMNLAPNKKALESALKLARKVATQ